MRHRGAEPHEQAEWFQWISIQEFPLPLQENQSENNDLVACFCILWAILTLLEISNLHFQIHALNKASKQSPKVQGLGFMHFYSCRNDLMGEFLMRVHEAIFMKKNLSKKSLSYSTKFF